MWNSRIRKYLADPHAASDAIMARLGTSKGTPETGQITMRPLAPLLVVLCLIWVSVGAYICVIEFGHGGNRSYVAALVALFFLLPLVYIIIRERRRWVWIRWNHSGIEFGLCFARLAVAKTWIDLKRVRLATMRLPNRTEIDYCAIIELMFDDVRLRIDRTQFDTQARQLLAQTIAHHKPDLFLESPCDDLLPINLHTEAIQLLK